MTDHYVVEWPSTYLLWPIDETGQPFILPSKSDDVEHDNWAVMRLKADEDVCDVWDEQHVLHMFFGMLKRECTPEKLINALESVHAAEMERIKLIKRDLYAAPSFAIYYVPLWCDECKSVVFRNVGASGCPQCFNECKSHATTEQIDRYYRHLRQLAQARTIRLPKDNGPKDAAE